VLESAQLPDGRWTRLLRYWRPTIRYCMETEVHVYALSIAASVLLSFFPFMIVIASVVRYVFKWRQVAETIYISLRDYFPGPLGEFVIDQNLRVIVARGPLQITSIVLLLITANGIFEPLEVALNKAWGVRKNRSYLKNQLVSLGLIFACGTLALASFILTSLNRQWIANSSEWLIGWGWAPGDWTTILVFKIAALPFSISALMLIYWLLPNRRVKPMKVLPHAILVGLALEGLKYFNLITLPFLQKKLRAEYGPFHISVTIVLWSFLAAMIVLAGAEWAARRARLYEEAEKETPREELEENR
jgi:membrane protein